MIARARFALFASLADGRSGAAVKAEFVQDGCLAEGSNAFGNDREADAVRNAAEPLKEGGIARVFVDIANEACVDFQEIEPEIVQLPDLAELMTKMLQADVAAGRLKLAAERPELGEVLQCATFANFQPEACGIRTVRSE